MKNFFRRVLSIFERLVVKLNHWEHIPGSSEKMLYIVPQVYRGDKIMLEDGTVIANGDTVAEIHVDNLKVGDIKDDLKTIFRIWDNEFKQLARIAGDSGEFAQIKAYYGRTVLYPIIRRRGFTILEMNKGVRTAFIGIWENILRIVFKAGKARDKSVLKTPRECWISRTAVLKRYASGKGKIDEKSF